MKRRPQLQQPTHEEIEQTKRVERALCNELNLLAREGLPLAVLLTGIGIAAADLITCHAGPEAVAPWFDKQARLVKELQGKPH